MVDWVSIVLIGGLGLGVIYLYQNGFFSPLAAAVGGVGNIDPIGDIQKTLELRSDPGAGPDFQKAIEAATPTTKFGGGLDLSPGGSKKTSDWLKSNPSLAPLVGKKAKYADDEPGGGVTYKFSGSAMEVTDFG